MKKLLKRTEIAQASEYKPNFVNLENTGHVFISGTSSPIPDNLRLMTEKSLPPKYEGVSSSPFNTYRGNEIQYKYDSN